MIKLEVQSSNLEIEREKRREIQLDFPPYILYSCPGNRGKSKFNHRILP